MLDTIPPFLVYLVGAPLALLVPNGPFRSAFLCLVPVAAGLILLDLPQGAFLTTSIAGQSVTLLRVDDLSFVFGLIFNIAAFLSLLFAWHVRDAMQQVATVLYAGAAVGAVFCGDLVSLFVFWEATAITSVFLIWATRSEGSYHTGMRYLIIQVGSGVILLSGVIIQASQTGSVAFEAMTLGGPGTWLILLGFGIKCAFPLLHNWLQDSYPAATATGTVTLSAFTTKLAVYALARGFPGTEILIYIGAAMTVFPIFFAAIENNLRRVLAYSLNNQLGFMVVGVGVGTPLALNGTAAHAFCHILYKALLFMSLGAVLHRTGTTKASELGGLYRSMPVTMVCCVIGAASISAFPLFSGFVSKSLIQSATADTGHWIVWLVLLFASVGVLEHSGIKIPYFTFFGHDSGIRCREAPWNMVTAMVITAALCVGLGVYPAPLYAILPYPVDYVPYTVGHVVTQLQVLVFALLAFALLMRGGLYPAEFRATNLDIDWLYRRALPVLAGWLGRAIDAVWSATVEAGRDMVQAATDGAASNFGPHGLIGRTVRVGNGVAWVTALLLVTLLVGYAAG